MAETNHTKKMIVLIGLGVKAISWPSFHHLEAHDDPCRAGGIARLYVGKYDRGCPLTPRYQGRGRSSDIQSGPLFLNPFPAFQASHYYGVQRTPRIESGPMWHVAIIKLFPLIRQRSFCNYVPLSS